MSDDAKWPELIEKLKQGEKETKPTPTRRIWKLLTPEQQKAITDLKRLPKQPQLQGRARVYQQAIQDARQVRWTKSPRKPDFYDRPSGRAAPSALKDGSWLGKGSGQAGRAG